MSNKKYYQQGDHIFYKVLAERYVMGVKDTLGSPKIQILSMAQEEYEHILALRPIDADQFRDKFESVIIILFKEVEKL